MVRRLLRQTMMFSMRSDSAGAWPSSERLHTSSRRIRSPFPWMALATAEIAERVAREGGGVDVAGLIETSVWSKSHTLFDTSFGDKQRQLTTDVQW